MKTANEVAEILKSSPRTVRRWGLSEGIGQVYGVQRLFTEDDVARLKSLIRSGPGNPLMGANQPKEYAKKKSRKKS